MKYDLFQIQQIINSFNDFTKVFESTNYEELLASNKVMLTKKGEPWRCGKNGYRLNWDKLIGEWMLFHNLPWLLLDKFKKEDEWYVSFTDGKVIVTETLRAARYNKKISKKATHEIIQLVKPQEKITIPTITYQLCLPAPKDIIEEALEEISRLSKEQNKLRTWQQELDYYKAKRNIDCNHLNGKLGYVINFGKRLGFDTKSFMNKLLKAYHPDKNPNVTEEEYEIVKRMWDLRK